MHAKAPLKIQKALERRLDLFIKNPYQPTLNNHWLTGKYRGQKSINITGDWRAIFKEKKDVIIFLLFGTHSQLYK
jgi:addiction module RelE/StbE family toxin